LTSVEYFVPEAEANDSAHVFANYLRAYTKPGDLVVDPFCESPAVVLQALALGRRIVAVSFNPLDALRMRQALVPSPTHELDAAVTRLADSPKVGVSLREHLQRLYRTTCPQCHKAVIAEYFVWERQADVPKRVHYHCPACGDAGARDCDESDAQVLSETQPQGLHYWYVLDRVAREEGSARKFAMRLLELYTPRNLYVLSNLVLKVEDLFAGSAVLEFLRLALLRCLELGSKLNPVPGEATGAHRSRLNPPARFAEWNAWRLFEEVTRYLTQSHKKEVPLVAQLSEVLSPGPTSPAPARAFAGCMPVRELLPALGPAGVRLIHTQPPPLGRTYWALPYLWTGWLYGHKAAASLWPLVRRRNSDWGWYLHVMRGTLSSMQKALHPDGHMVLLGTGKGLAYHEALTLAVAGANLGLESALYHPCELEGATKPFAGLRGDYRLTCSVGAPTPPWPMSLLELKARLAQFAVAAAEELLQERGEPAPFARLHYHIWEILAQRGILQRVMSMKELGEPLTWVRAAVQGALEAEVNRTLARLWEGDEDGECLWWLVQPPETTPLTERVEQAALETLLADETLDTEEFMQRIYARFPGLLTPDSEWVMACLKSYGQLGAAGRWALREQERPEDQLRARTELRGLVSDLGLRWGYEVARQTVDVDVQWTQGDREVVLFVILRSAALSGLFNLPAIAGFAKTRRFVIFPEARQALLQLRLVRSPTLGRQLAARGWQFVHVEDFVNWASRADVVSSDLDSLISLDAVAGPSRTQLSLV